MILKKKFVPRVDLFCTCSELVADLVGHIGSIEKSALGNGIEGVNAHACQLLAVCIEVPCLSCCMQLLLQYLTGQW